MNKRATRMMRKGMVIGALLFSSFILHPSSFLYADGGTFRIAQRRGDLQVSVFTAPTSLRTGWVDISVLVQDALTGAVRTDIPVTIVLRLSADPAQQLSIAATNEAATNKLFRAAKFQIAEAGTWQVEVTLDGPKPEAPVQFDIEIGTGPPPWWGMGLWIGWPFIVVVLFGVHQWLVRRRTVA